MFHLGRPGSLGSHTRVYDVLLVVPLKPFIRYYYFLGRLYTGALSFALGRDVSTDEDDLDSSISVARSENWNVKVENSREPTLLWQQ